MLKGYSFFIEINSVNRIKFNENIRTDYKSQFSDNKAKSNGYTKNHKNLFLNIKNKN